MKSTGIRIREMREAKGMSRVELAHRLGRKRLAIWRMETGAVGVDSDYLPKIAAALECRAEDLLPVCGEA